MKRRLFPPCSVASPCRIPHTAAGLRLARQKNPSASFVPLLPVCDTRLFFVHFRPTSFVAQHGDEIAGFVTGFVSQTFLDEACIHFAGVAPGFRGKGVGRALYERFFVAAKAQGCRVVRCVTSPVNQASIAFHLRMGFVAQDGATNIARAPYVEGYDGQGEDRVLFSKLI